MSLRIFTSLGLSSALLDAFVALEALLVEALLVEALPDALDMALLEEWNTRNRVLASRGCRHGCSFFHDWEK